MGTKLKNDANGLLSRRDMVTVGALDVHLSETYGPGRYTSPRMQVSEGAQETNDVPDTYRLSHPTSTGHILSSGSHGASGHQDRTHSEPQNIP